MPAQSKAYPQRQDCQHHGDQNRQGKHPGVVTQQGRHLHRRHAAVVHGTDAGANEYTAADQLDRTEPTQRQQAQRHPGRKKAGQYRSQGNQRVIAHRRA